MNTINVKDLIFTYPEANSPVVNGVSFTIEQGGVFGLLGPSGAGKSTIQKILFGLLKGHRGHAEINGKLVQDWGSDLYEHIGVSFELPNHFTKLTALENLNYFSSLYKNKSLNPMDVLTWLGLEEAANLPVAGFSKGMKNRLSMARALVHNPDILFLDEPTAGLDPVSTLKVQTLIKTLKSQGKTILINTHNMHIAEQSCDSVAFLHKGKIAEIDTPNALKLKYGKQVVDLSYIKDGNVEKVQFELLGVGKNKEFLSLIDQYPVQKIHSKEASLDDVFRTVTGANLKEGLDLVGGLNE